MKMITVISISVDLVRQVSWSDEFLGRVEDVKTKGFSYL